MDRSPAVDVLRGLALFRNVPGGSLGRALADGGFRLKGVELEVVSP